MAASRWRTRYRSILVGVHPPKLGPMSLPAATAAETPLLGSSVTPRVIDSYLRAVPPVDEVGVSERAAGLSTRSVKRESKLHALDLAIRMCDLTTLEGKDTPGKVIQLASKAVRPDPADPTIPPVAALCVYPNMVPYAVEALEGTGVAVASVATYFPSGQAPISVKTADVSWAVGEGADEIDMVIDRGAFLSGDYLKVYEEIMPPSREACATRPPQGNPRNRRAGHLMTMCGGPPCWPWRPAPISSRPPPARYPPRTPPPRLSLVMLEAIRDFYAAAGRAVGMKPAGGISAAKHRCPLSGDGLRNPGSRPGSPLHASGSGRPAFSTIFIMQIRWVREGRYQSPDYFTKD